MSANAADLVPAVEAYLEANGLKETLSAMKAEAKAKKMTPSKTVRARLAIRRAPRETKQETSEESRGFCADCDDAPPPRPAYASPSAPCPSTPFPRSCSSIS